MATQHEHSHHEHHGSELITAARDALVTAGEQWTGMRESVFEELARHDDDLDAAFGDYEHRVRPHATAAQEFASVGADLVLPATWAAIEARNTRLHGAQPL